MTNGEVRVRVAGRSFGYRGETYTRGDELTVDEATVENHSRTLERVDEADAGDEPADASDEDEDEGEDETEATDIETPEAVSYDRDELEAMEYGDLQTLAVEADTDAVDGRSSRDDIVEALSDE